MKKLIFILFFAIAFITCEKGEEIFCWKCTYTDTIQNTFYEQRYCDKTLKEIEKTKKPNHTMLCRMIYEPMKP